MDETGSSRRRANYARGSRILWRPRITFTTLVMAAALVGLPRIDLLAGGLFPLIQALHPAFCLAALGIAIVFVAIRQFGSALSLVAGLILSLLPTLIPTTDSIPAQPQATETLTVLSINVEHSQADVSAIRQLLALEGPEIVVLVEVDESFIDRVLDGDFGAQLRYRSPIVSGGTSEGTVILSAYPLISEAPISGFDGSRLFDQPVAVVRHPQLGKLRVAAIHVKAPVVEGGRLWKEDLESLNRWQAAHADLPLLLAGDFNATYAHPAFRRIADKFVNSALAAGPVSIPTWPSRSPFAAIDHVLATGLMPLQWMRVDIANSDHRGLLVRLAGTDR